MSEVLAVDPVDGATRIVSQLRELVAERAAALNVIEEQRQAILVELRTYEKALSALLDEPLPRARTKRPVEAPRARTRVGPERLERIREAVLAYAEDHEEFRQVDIRASVPGDLARSSTMASAFETLRQQNVIRFARQDGVNKYFRLTRTGLRDQAIAQEADAAVRDAA